MPDITTAEGRAAYREDKFGLQGNDVWIDGAEMDVALDGLDIAQEMMAALWALARQSCRRRKYRGSIGGCGDCATCKARAALAEWDKWREGK